MDLGSVCAKPEPIGCPLPPGPSRQGLLTITQPQEGPGRRSRSEESECIRTPQSKIGVGGDGSSTVHDTSAIASDVQWGVCRTGPPRQRHNARPRPRGKGCEAPWMPWHCYSNLLTGGGRPGQAGSSHSLRAAFGHRLPVGPCERPGLGTVSEPRALLCQVGSQPCERVWVAVGAGGKYRMSLSWPRPLPHASTHCLRKMSAAPIPKPPAAQLRNEP